MKRFGFLAGFLLLASPALAQPANDPLCAKYSGVLLGQMRGQPARLDCRQIKELSTDAEDVRLAGTIAENVFALHEMAGQHPAEQIVGSANADRCRSIRTSVRSYYACRVSSFGTVYYVLAADGWAESVELELDLAAVTRQKLAQLTNPTEAAFQLFGEMLLAANARIAKPLPLRMSGSKLTAQLPVKRASTASQPANDPLCAKYAGRSFGTMQGQPARLDCAGITALAAKFRSEVQPAMQQVTEAMERVIAALGNRPIVEAIGEADPAMARRCQMARADNRRVYACAIEPGIMLSFPLAADGRAESIHGDWDLQVLLTATADLTNVSDTAYQFVWDVVSEANKNSARPLPIRLNGHKLQVRRPVGATGSAAATSDDPLCAKYAGVLMGHRNGQPVRHDCAGLKALTTAWASDMQQNLTGLSGALFAFHAAVRDKPIQAILDGSPSTANRCKRLTSASGITYACAATSSYMLYLPVSPDGWVTSVNTELDLDEMARTQIPGLSDPTEASFTLLGDAMLSANSRLARPLPMNMFERKLQVRMPVTR
jgi:hypothetical protein